MFCMNCLKYSGPVETQPGYFDETACYDCGINTICAVAVVQRVFCLDCRKLTLIPINTANKYYASRDIPRRKLLCGCIMEIENGSNFN